MNFNTAKKIVAFLVGISFVICIGGLVVFEKDSIQSQYCAIAALAALLAAVAVVLKWGRCPWCGHLIIRGLFSKTVCPYCKRDLETGKKKKGKGGKK
ncbi:MAG: hypothetical protein EOM54_03520 [Clostridia bacterium]|nr:hypothetical protein [Clostridia bacterium]